MTYIELLALALLLPFVAAGSLALIFMNKDAWKRPRKRRLSRRWE